MIKNLDTRYEEGNYIPCEFIIVFCIFRDSLDTDVLYISFLKKQKEITYVRQ